MSRDMFPSFIASHHKSYDAIARACVRHSVKVSLGVCPNEIIVHGECIPRLFRDYMRKCQPDFIVTCMEV